MASQLNPAWQRKSASSSHLAKISARFLSEGPQGGQQSELCQVIPFLLEHPDQNWITRDLCQVLGTRGHQSALCHLDETSGTNANDLQKQIRARCNEYELCLVPTTSPLSIRRFEFDHVVLFVNASLDGILAAYQQIKYLAQAHKPAIGIAIVGARDQHAAWRHFRKLAVGSLRYLDVPLLNLGFLPEQVVPGNGAPDHHRENYLARISERLVRSGFHCSIETAPGDQQPA